MNKKTLRNQRVMATTLLAMLTLSACGNSDGGSSDESGADSATSEQASEAVYQFDEARVADDDLQEPFTVTDAAVAVKLSSELSKAIPDGAAMTVDHHTVRAKAFETGMCRIDLGLSYNNAGQQAMTASRTSDGGSSDPVPERLVGALTSGDSGSGAQFVDQRPSDDQLEEGGEYVTKDLSNVTFVDECSEDAEDPMVHIHFSYPNGDGELDEFAVFRVAVMSGGGQAGGDGTTIALTGDTEADVSPSGKWMQPTE